MSKLKIFSSRRTDNTEPEISHGYAQHIKLFHFLLREYGSFEFVLDIADTVLDFLRKFHVRNRKYQKALTLLKYGIPAVVIISDFITKIKAYLLIKSGKNTVSNNNIDKVRELFGIKDHRVTVDNYPFIVGSEVTQWLLQRPKTKHLRILGYHQFDSLQNLSDVYKEDDSTLITVFEMDSVKFAWMVRMYRSIEGDLYVRFSDVYATMEHISKIPALKCLVYKEFIHHFDIKANVLQLSVNGLSTCPRQAIIENPRQFNIKLLASEIRKTLKRGKKRGFVFVGVPGTGKSTIIHCLESIISEYPIVYLSSNCFSSAGAVKETFQTLQYIQPCLAIVEDLDSCELKDKRQALGEFLEQIDDVDNKLNIVILSTVNDTSLVHYSLINRPGRFDVVIRINSPQDIDEIYSIMKCRYDKNKKTDPEISGDFISSSRISRSLMNKILNRGYTQADICEIIEKALLIDNIISNETLELSVHNLEESKEALRGCNFGGRDPSECVEENECIEECEQPCAPDTVPTSIYPVGK